MNRRSPIRHFSLDEANRMLPLVRRIVEDILDQHAAENFDEIPDLVAELAGLGCHFKGFGEGLVDWYSCYAGRSVFLCWRVGEEEIGWWHQLDAGFAGRQPILPGQGHAFTGGPCE